MLKIATGFQIKTCEMHTCGEPARIIERIEPPIKYPEKSTVLEKRQFLSDHYDYVRKMVILEPRGHRDMFGVLFTDPDENGGSDFGLIFLNNEGYAPMCGHATIAMGRYLLEKKKITPKIPETKIQFDCPCGIIKVSVEWDGNRVGNTKFINVPAFVQSLDYKIYVPELQSSITCDIAFGGNFYAVVSEDQLGVDFNHDSPAKIVDSASHLFQTLKKSLVLFHPYNKKVNFLYGIIVRESNVKADLVKVLCVYGIKSCDRCPCGSGTTALLACQYFRGNLQLNQKLLTRNPFVSEQCYFQGIPIEEVTLKSREKELKSVLVEITGRANFIGENLMTFEEDDHLKHGFLI